MDSARILRTFIDSPDNRTAWLAAWDLVIGQITSYLRTWESRGRRLPLALFAGENKHRDLAVVVMSGLFIANSHGSACPLIRFLIPQVHRSDDAFIDQFLAIIRKTARQNVHKLERENGLEAWNIRRNLRRTLRQSKGEFRDVSGGKFSEWAWTKAEDGDRADRPTVEGTVLHTWVTAACRDESHTPGQCRQVFTSLDRDDRFRNTLPYFPLVKTFVTVQLDHDCPLEVVPDSPLLVRIRGLMRIAANPVSGEVLSNDLPHLAQLAGLNSDEAAGVSAALMVWLHDWIEHLDNDSLREYLNEQLGEIPLAVYQKRYHYLWNTLTSKCKDRIIQRVKKQLRIADEV